MKRRWQSSVEDILEVAGVELEVEVAAAVEAEGELADCIDSLAAAKVAEVAAGGKEPVDIGPDRQIDVAEVVNGVGSIGVGMAL